MILPLLGALPKEVRSPWSVPDTTVTAFPQKQCAHRCAHTEVSTHAPVAASQGLHFRLRAGAPHSAPHRHTNAGPAAARPVPWMSAALHRPSAVSKHVSIAARMRSDTMTLRSRSVPAAHPSPCMITCLRQSIRRTWSSNQALLMDVLDATLDVQPLNGCMHDGQEWGVF